MKQLQQSLRRYFVHERELCSRCGVRKPKCARLPCPWAPVPTAKPIKPKA